MKRAPRNYTLWLNGKRMPKRTYRFRQRAIQSALVMLFERATGNTIEIITKAGRLTWSASRRANNLIHFHGV